MLRSASAKAKGIVMREPFRRGAVTPSARNMLPQGACGVPHAEAECCGCFSSQAFPFVGDRPWSSGPSQASWRLFFPCGGRQRNTKKRAVQRSFRQRGGGQTSIFQRCSGTFSGKARRPAAFPSVWSGRFMDNCPVRNDRAFSPARGKRHPCQGRPVTLARATCRAGKRPEQPAPDATGHRFSSARSRGCAVPWVLMCSTRLPAVRAVRSGLRSPSRAGRGRYIRTFRGLG